MPRIRVAFGVVVAVTLCIGFNMAHYPVVWQMVTVRPNAVAAAESTPAAEKRAEAPRKTPSSTVAASPAKSVEPVTVVARPNTPAPSAAAESKPAAKKEAAKKEASTEKADPKPEKSTAGDSSKKKGGHNGTAKPKSTTNDLAAEKPAEKKEEKSAPNEIRPPLVPLVRSQGDGEKAKRSTEAAFASVSTTKEPGSDDRPGVGRPRFERLPPLSFAEVAPTDPIWASAGNAIPFYPTTGR